MRKFNKVIEEAGLLEIHLCNSNFTWSRNGSSNSNSLIDQFLVDKEWDELFDNSRVNRKARVFSDHFSLLL